jgi:type I restriction enzyme, S subunit
MSDFYEIPIGQHLKLTSGFPFDSSKFSNEGFPLIRIRDILYSETETYFTGRIPLGYVIHAGDILVGMDGDFHVAKWKGRDALLNQRVLKVESLRNTEVYLDYVFHWIGPFVKKINDVTPATTVKHLSTSDLTKAIAKFPSFDSQKKIAAVLTAADTAIEKTETLIAKYQQIKAGLMHDLFTRGVQPNGQLRPPRSEAQELYQETAIGWIPKDWSVTKLGALASIISGVTLGSKNISLEVIEVPYLRVANVQDGYLNLAEIKTIFVTRKTLDNLRLLPGDVLMNEGGDFDKLGRGSVWAGQIDNCIHQNHVFRVRPSSAVLEPNYLSFYSQSAFGKKYFLVSSKQSTNLASINSSQLNAYPIALPSPAEQRLIASRINVANASLDTLLIEVDKRRKQKLGLMLDLLTGSVPVKVDPREMVNA